MFHGVENINGGILICAYRKIRREVVEEEGIQETNEGEESFKIRVNWASINLRKSAEGGRGSAEN